MFDSKGLTRHNAFLSPSILQFLYVSGNKDSRRSCTWLTHHRNIAPHTYLQVNIAQLLTKLFRNSKAFRWSCQHFEGWVVSWARRSLNGKITHDNLPSSSLALKTCRTGATNAWQCASQVNPLRSHTHKVSFQPHFSPLPIVPSQFGVVRSKATLQELSAGEFRICAVTCPSLGEGCRWVAGQSSRMQLEPFACRPTVDVC